eukprot:710595_1
MKKIKKQFQQFKKKREQVVSRNVDKISEKKLDEPSNIVKDIYIQKEKEKALWNQAKNKKKGNRDKVKNRDGLKSDVVEEKRNDDGYGQMYTQYMPQNMPQYQPYYQGQYQSPYMYEYNKY